MMENKKFVIRGRALIYDEGELLVVRHAPSDTYVALPGGHLEWGENVQECLKREIIEELGIEPIIGGLQYVNVFCERDSVQSFEFFFEIKNAKEYRNYLDSSRTHAYELSEVVWVRPETDLRILPTGFAQSFKAGNLFSKEVRFITDEK